MTNNKKSENHEVTVYSTQTCPWCHKTKDFLKEKGVSFKDIDVGSDQEAANVMVEKSGQMGVPVTDIDGKIIIGFDKEEIEKALS
jgi:glutaredoxin 3